ncbi:MAG TPA: diacylglycerol kinase family protein, partial [Thermoleophilaceae bacterium]|nr:diacylglycerol kinase family protein [Thermoleophilaceae bacterium]
MAASEAITRRAEALAEAVLLERRPRKRMLVIVNPYATTVSERLKSLVVYALRGRYEVDAVETRARDHATEICAEAARERYDVVVAFGGDGTANEAANGLAGSRTPLTCLPGGATNVFCRTLGIPGDVVDATEHLLGLADAFEPRRVDLGTVDGRHFVFASGAGLDASVVERVDRHPRTKSRLGEWYFTYAAISTFTRRYLVRPPLVRVEAGGRTVEGVTLVVQNSDPFTFFGERPIRVCEGAGLGTGAVAATVLERASPVDIPTVLARVFSGSAQTVSRHRRIASLGAVSEVR